MAQKTLSLTILTQEKQLLEREVVSLTVMTTEGEITVLPDHVPLFSKLGDGELVFRYQDGNSLQSDDFAVSGGFIDVSPDGKVTVLADNAVRVAEIDLAESEKARQNAEEAMQNRGSEIEFRLAEASLRKAMTELKAAQKRKKSY